MHIAVNVLPLSTEHRMRGTGVYTDLLVSSLKTYGKSHTYSWFTRPAEIPSHTDVVHYPFFDPFFLTLPLAKRFPTVVTVHDLIPLVFPSHFPPGIRGTIKWQIQRTSLRTSSAVITDSQCSKEDITRIIPMNAHRVHVVPLAPSPKFSVANPADIVRMKKRYAIPSDYVLYVGDVNWNKNITTLLTAWKEYASSRFYKKNTVLVLAGSAFTNPDLSEAREINKIIDTLAISKTVLRPGFVQDEDMSAMYSGSACTVVPSWYEGFGFPVLEAMMCESPVIASNRGSVPEISGPSFVIDPGKPVSIASAIRQSVSLSLKERKALGKEGRLWAKTFTWRRVALETIAVYEHVAGRSST